MIYLDYSANTPADPQVLDRFCSVERRCIGNANSLPRSSIPPVPANPTTSRSRGWPGSPAMRAGTSSPPRWSIRPSAAL